MSNKKIRWSPLDAWIEDMGLEGFVDDELQTHFKIFGIDESDRESLIRLIMISLRQALGNRKQ